MLLQRSQTSAGIAPVALSSANDHSRSDLVDDFREAEGPAARRARADWW
jgi:hypothetical protein